MQDSEMLATRLYNKIQRLNDQLQNLGEKGKKKNARMTRRAQNRLLKEVEKMDDLAFLDWITVDENRRKLVFELEAKQVREKRMRNKAAE